MTRRRTVGLLICLAVGATPVAGQRASGSLTVGASRLRVAQQEPFAAITLSPAFAYWNARRALTGSASLAHLESGAWSTQGFLSGTLQSAPTRRGFVAEVGASADGSRHSDGFGTVQLLARTRLHRIGESEGLWIGAQVGSQRALESWRPVLQGELGVAIRTDRSRLALAVQPTRADTFRFTDLRVGIEYGWRDVELGASGGVRAGRARSDGSGDERRWGGVVATWWFAARWALEAAAGSYAADLTQRFPSGRYSSLALRLGGAERRPIEALERYVDPRELREAERAGVTRFVVERLSPEDRLAGGDRAAGSPAQVRLLLRVRAPRAKRVELNGDPSGWTPLPMRKGSDGWWENVVDAEPGACEVVIRVDGGAWIVPPGLATVRDEFGGRAGRFVVR